MLFVYVEDVRKTTHLVNTDQVLKCTQRRGEGEWYIKLTHDTGITVSDATFVEFTAAIQAEIKG